MHALHLSVQSESFAAKIACVQSNKEVLKESKLAALCPVMREGVLCVGGRLQFSGRSDDERHHMILPGKSHVARLIIRATHITQGHMGVNQVLACTREKFWFLSGRQAVKSEL